MKKIFIYDSTPRINRFLAVIKKQEIKVNITTIRSLSKMDLVLSTSVFDFYFISHQGTQELQKLCALVSKFLNNPQKGQIVIIYSPDTQGARIIKSCCNNSLNIPYELLLNNKKLIGAYIGKT